MEQKMNEYRYFIADDNKTGTLIFSNEIKGEDMLLLVGYVIYFYNAASVDDIVDKLVTMYGFSVISLNVLTRYLRIKYSIFG